MTDVLLPIMTRYTNYTMTGDALPEINSLSYLPFESNYADPPVSGRLALVLVEPRLLESTGDATLRADLVQRLQRLKGDLRAEGLHTRFILANLYRGTVHKDGRIVLALRQFFREVKSSFTNFEGALLIGNFPEASLVRRVAWCPGFLTPRQLSIGTELISERAEVVLADLTGNWESIYRQSDFTAEDISAIPDAATTTNGWFDGESVRNCEFSSTDFTLGQSQTFRDAFFIDDAVYTILENRTSPSPRLRLRLNQAERNNEVDFSDRSMINILAKPDISVSRINAFRIAVNPNPALRGTDGRGFLNAVGNPQTVSSPAPLVNSEEDLFSFYDIDLERRLLVDYFDRNHRFRNGAFANLPFRGAVISGSTDFSPDGYEGLVNAAATDFQPCVKTAHANLQQYVQFYKTPAVLKYIMAHSNARISEFRDGTDPAVLATEAGGLPPRWIYRSGQHVPSFEGQGRNADLYVHRTLWQYNTLKDAGVSIIIHGGCNVNSIPETQTNPYSSRSYGRWNNAEGILFYTNCAAIFSRAKGFNDAPNGFIEGYRLSDRANLGSCWKSYFNAQANDGGLSTYNIQRKRAYFWSINGDWTLRIRNKNGLGILALNPELRSVEVHPNRAWIDGWNFDAALNRIRGIGDLDGDGIDEFVVTSDWGIGLLKYNGIQFRTLMAAPRDTWFGGWRYDATVNSGRDRIMDIENFTGTDKREILVWSSWGIAALEYNGVSLFPSRIHQNGTRLGGWLIDTANNTYWGCGQFDRDRRKAMLLTSPWGLGIISLQNNSHIYMAPNGTRFGGWLLNSADNTIRLIADLDGDGVDEILISSPWGIGVLKMVDGALTAIAMHANGENLGGYVVRNTNNFALADNFKGGAEQQILVMDSTGIHLLCLLGNRLQRIALAGNGTRIDGWVIDTSNNRLQRAGNMNANVGAEFVIRSPWGVGMMGIDTANRFRCYGLYAYNTVLRDWHLQSGDVIVGTGNFAGDAARKELLIVKP
ncbi:hypothetical protein PGN35_019080 [Nodosilinea sp. PGN35]|uniref:hypothetical protein n=1 Tax=Nodosilinea sp. PGN35 TaxID=3020489 RepID=UPI0023B2AB91|nr:hypothetical protein [Nodosilinea sp. TSF1-S3]MDF0369836.1 hypothetical protein [Nodosilinea sp. TSF1-S3]